MKNDYVINDKDVVIFLNRRNGQIFSTHISVEDFDKANDIKGKWCVIWNEITQSFYVQSATRTNGKKTTISLHRLITGFIKGMHVDHINHDTLDNRRNNLRIISNSENQQNRKGATRSSTTGIRGVYWSKKSKKWKVQIKVNKVQIHIGYFNSIEEAEHAAIEARSKYMKYSEELAK